MKRYLFLVAVVLLALLSSCEKDGLEYVDPFIGTEGEGTEYGGLMPYIGVPFGSAQWTPMTRLNDVSCLSYNAADTLLLGFIASRQPAIWMGDWGQVSFMAQKEDAVTDYADRGLRIESEKYTPYSGNVTAGGISTRFAALEHSALFEFSDAKHFVIDASRLSGGQYSDHNPHPGHLDFSADGYSVSGWNSDLFDGSHTSPKPNFRGYFYIEFSRPYTDFDCRNNDQD